MVDAKKDTESGRLTDCSARGDAGPGKMEAVTCVVPKVVRDGK